MAKMVVLWDVNNVTDCTIRGIPDDMALVANSNQKG